MIESFVLRVTPRPLRPVVQFVLGPFLAAADTLYATLNGEITKVAQEPLVFVSSLVAATNGLVVHGGVWGYVLAYVAAAARVFTSPSTTPNTALGRTPDRPAADGTATSPDFVGTPNLPPA